VKRREFLSLLGGVSAASSGSWPLAARAQQPTMPVVGFLGTASAGPFAHLVVSFRRGLQETGFVEGRNVAVALRWVRGQYDLLPAVSAPPSAIARLVGTPSGRPLAVDHEGDHQHAGV
jgi:putative tryptophan/tyrosine transport system substrate-binding protein